MTDLSRVDNVMLSTEDFSELIAEASGPATTHDRIASVVQTYTIVFGYAAALAAGRYAWVKLSDWHETRQFERTCAKTEKKS